jgi:hypothetical protein
MVAADHALVSGQIARTTDFETAFVDGLPVSATNPSARVEVGGAGSICGYARRSTGRVDELHPGRTALATSTLRQWTTSLFRSRAWRAGSTGAGRAPQPGSIARRSAALWPSSLLPPAGGWLSAGNGRAVSVLDDCAAGSPCLRFSIPGDASWRQPWPPTGCNHRVTRGTRVLGVDPTPGRAEIPGASYVRCRCCPGHWRSPQVALP